MTLMNLFMAVIMLRVAIINFDQYKMNVWGSVSAKTNYQKQTAWNYLVDYWLEAPLAVNEEIVSLKKWMLWKQSTIVDNFFSGCHNWWIEHQNWKTWTSIRSFYYSRCDSQFDRCQLSSRNNRRVWIKWCIRSDHWRTSWWDQRYCLW